MAAFMLHALHGSVSMVLTMRVDVADGSCGEGRSCTCRLRTAPMCGRRCLRKAHALCLARYG